MYEWYPYPKTRPAESGDYLILFSLDGESKEVIPEVATFYNKGDFFAPGNSTLINATPEERFVDALIRHPITVKKSGFYYQHPDEKEYWELKPIFWAYLPEPPEGYRYN